MHSCALMAGKLWGDILLGFFYPNRCQICHLEHAAPDEGYVCKRCWSRPGAIQFIRPPFCERCGMPFSGEISGSFQCSNCRDVTLHFTQARAAVAAHGLVLDVIHQYKYSRALWFEPFLADLLIREAKPVLGQGNWDLIVPVPLHPLKRREREFNQAERLASRLSRGVGIPMNTHLLKRILPTRTQTLLTRSERAANVAGAFRFCGQGRLKGERVVLIDDVLTTGATTSACAKVLQANGSGDICVWTVARGL